MTRTSLKDWDCSVARTLDIIGDKWALMILRNAFFGTQKFSGFQSELGIAKNILSARLKHLVEHGILRRVAPQGGGHARYKLTSAGIELHTVLIALLQWGDRHIGHPDGPPVDIVDVKTGRRVAPMAVRSHSGETLTPFDMRFQPRRS